MSNERIDLEAINMPDMKYFTNEATWQGWHDTVEEMIAELKRCYEEIDEVTKWKDHWKRTSQTWSKVVEIFDPKANNAELNDAISKAFGHDASE